MLDALTQLAIATESGSRSVHRVESCSCAATEAGWSTHTSRQLFVVALAFVAYVAAVDRSVATGSSPPSWPAWSSAPWTKGTEQRSPSPKMSRCSPRSWCGSSSAPTSSDRCSRSGFDVRAVVYAVLSLTLIRMVPVAVALLGPGFRPVTTAFMGWFGPRGLASVVFTLIAFEELKGTAIDTPLFEVATWTILLSVVLHGLTARPLASAYGAKIRSGADELPEAVDLPEPRVRRHLQKPTELSSG